MVNSQHTRKTVWKRGPAWGFEQKVAGMAVLDDRAFSLTLLAQFCSIVPLLQIFIILLPDIGG